MAIEKAFRTACWKRWPLDFRASRPAMAVFPKRSPIWSPESWCQNRIWPGVEHWLDRLAADDQLRDSLGKRAAQTIKEKFDLTTQIEKLEEIYLGLRQ